MAGWSRWRRRREELARAREELDAAQPFLGLAREIQAEVERIAADPSTHAALLDELIDELAADERMKLAQTIFERLSPEQQWSIVERVYGDEELRAYLERARERRLAEARHDAERERVFRAARERDQLDTRLLVPGEQLTLGLFRHNDVQAAVARGHSSAVCARRLVLRAEGEAMFRVIEDTFNPNGGYFVTAEYSEETWRTHERFDGHAVVRVGSITDTATGPSFEPVLYLRGRVDFENGGRTRVGRLHLGFAMLSDLDLFVS